MKSILSPSSHPSANGRVNDRDRVRGICILENPFLHLPPFHGNTLEVWVRGMENESFMASSLHYVWGWQDTLLTISRRISLK